MKLYRAAHRRFAFFSSEGQGIGDGSQGGTFRNDESAVRGVCRPARTRGADVDSGEAALADTISFTPSRRRV